MAQAAKSQEPSMEEILASIRRIIAEDDSEKSAERSAETASVESNSDAAAAPPGDEQAIQQSYSQPPESSPARIGARSGTAKAARSSAVLDMTEPTASPPTRSDGHSIDSSPAPVPPVAVDYGVGNEAVPPTHSGGAHDEERGGLISSATSAAVDSAFNALAQTVLVHNARTLEDLVREMLRPMLKVWLDDNLPGMVERLVRAEIERVSRGRGG
jgi:cell pole-organizing protein PopZ